MKSQVTPKQVARAIHVSESSVKRWCDRGVIPTVRTAGGHRRITVDAVLSFLRQTDHRLVRPEVLGLPATTGQGERVTERACRQFRDALVAGDEETCRQVVFDLYLAQRPHSVICDQIIAEAFHQIGDLWGCGEVEVYQERRACEICLRVLAELRLGTPPPPSTAPVALGGAPSGDHYHLPTTMIELVLREAGWQAASLGTGLPFETLEAAVREHRPRLFWLSVSHLADEEAFVAGYQAWHARVGGETAIAVGGRALHEGLRRRMTYAAYCDTLHQLCEFAEKLHSPPPSAAPTA